MFDSLVDLVTASAISYLVIAGFVWLDAWFPVVPGESLIITGAVLAAQGSLSIWLVLVAGVGGRDRRRQLHLPARPQAWHPCRPPAFSQREEQGSARVGAGAARAEAMGESSSRGTPRRAHR